jgi:hypothetical protein
MAGVIAERIAGVKINFSGVPTKHSAEVLSPNAPRTRKINNSLSRLADDATQTARIKEYVQKEMLEGKVYSWYPYSVNRLFGRGTDGVTISYTKPLKGGFERVPFGPNPEDVVYLNVACTSEPLSLRNPECFHHFHMYAK